MMEQIYILIPKVMADIGAVAKTRQNQQQGYAFRGIEDMYQAAHPAMVKHGVFCCPQVLEQESADRQMRNGSPAIRVTLKISHKFYASDGSFVEVITCGEGIDTSDKATNKAMSAAMKYAFIELFSIPTQDVEDSDRTTLEVGTLGKGDIAEPVILTRPKAKPEPVKVPEGNGQPVEVEPAEVESPYISVHQKSYLARRFRESVKPELDTQANELRHQALFALEQSRLFKSKFIDTDGNPTQDYILVSEYDAVGKALVRAAKSL